MNQTVKSKFAPLIAVVVAAVLFVIWMLMPGQEPIPDTNGPDDRTLCQLTEADICADSFSYTAGLRTSTGRTELPGGWIISDGMTFSAKELSGVVEILWADYLLPSDFYLEISHFSVEGGNARLVVINEGQIVAEIQPGDDILCRLDNLTGMTSLRLAVESAAFTLVIPSHIYDEFDHS
jgi:hypothetical protein